MKTNDQNLGATVTHWHADAEPPTALRIRILENATVTATPLRHAPRVHRRRVWWATGTAAAISGLAVFAVVTMSAPARPAFADVEAAMAKVKTVQWETEYSDYNAATGKVIHFTTQVSARLNPPTMYTKFDSGTVQLETPDVTATLVNAKDTKAGKHRLVVQDKQARIPSIPDAVADLRQQIEQKIIPPTLTTPDNPNLTTVVTVGENGRELLRFDSQLGRKRDNPDRLTRPGSRGTLWADPGTRRAVRTRSEYYDGTHHSIVISKNFRYDEPLPNSLFKMPSTSRL